MSGDDILIGYGYTDVRRVAGNIESFLSESWPAGTNLEANITNGLPHGKHLVRHLLIRYPELWQRQ